MPRSPGDGPQTPDQPPAPWDPADPTPRGAWLLIGTIAAAKLTTLAVVVWLSRSAETGSVVAATTWHWLVVAGVLIAGPLLFRYRLRRVRAKRERLRRAEWMITDEASYTPPGSGRRPRLHL